MSLSQTLLTAVSGLTVSSRSADIIASNLANYSTDAYGRRTLSLASVAMGGGVQITGVSRQSDPILIGDRRQAQAVSAAENVTLSFYQKIEKSIGMPASGSSLGDRMSALDSALLLASQSPGSDAALTSVLYAGHGVASQLREISAQVQQSRMQAESAIAGDVRILNESLAQVAAINQQIPRLTALRQDVSGLMDQRQALIDKIADILPLRELSGDGGAITLYTTGGIKLLDGHPAEFSFISATAISADIDSLSTLQINGQPIGAAIDGPLGKGSLTANFAIRDVYAPQLQATLDVVAADIVERFQRADPDGVVSGAGALFTDGGQVFNGTTLSGLAARITLNSAADPSRGGSLWKIAAGISASGPVENGDGRYLTSLISAMTERVSNGGATLSVRARTATETIADFVSNVATERVASASQASFAASRSTILRESEAAGGVDSDVETQNLMSVETQYAANANVIRAVSEMLDYLLRIG